MIDLAEVAEAMVTRLMDRAAECGVDLSGITVANFNLVLDERFGDGGEARCEQFADMAWEYALQFGAFGEQDFEMAKAEAIAAALHLLQERVSQHAHC